MTNDEKFEGISMCIGLLLILIFIPISIVHDVKDKKQSEYLIEIVDKNERLGGILGGKTKYEITYRTTKYVSGKAEYMRIDTDNVNHYTFTKYNVGNKIRTKRCCLPTYGY